MKLVPSPRTAEVWHPIEEFSSFCELLVKETDETLSLTERLFSAPTQCFHADASEGFQGAALGEVCCLMREKTTVQRESQTRKTARPRHFH